MTDAKGKLVSICTYKSYIRAQHALLSKNELHIMFGIGHLYRTFTAFCDVSKINNCNIVGLNNKRQSRAINISTLRSKLL